jgi:hypothetical protein
MFKETGVISSKEGYVSKRNVYNYQYGGGIIQKTAI